MYIPSTDTSTEISVTIMPTHLTAYPDLGLKFSQFFLIHFLTYTKSNTWKMLTHDLGKLRPSNV